MRISFFFATIVVFACGEPPNARGVTPIEPPANSRQRGEPIEPPVSPAPKTRQPTERIPVQEYSGDAIDVVLRSLARKAKINLVVSPSVTGTINLRLEDKSPREVIDVICQANGLLMEEMNGVNYVLVWDDRLKETAGKVAHLTKLMFDAYLAKGFTRAEALALITMPGAAKLEAPQAAKSLDRSRPPKR